MKKIRAALCVLIIVIAAIISVMGLAEEMRITTISPSQSTIRTVRGAFGTTYRNRTDAEIGDNNFIVEGNVGVGEDDVKTLTTGGVNTGNLNVNDIWLRGATPPRWASQKRHFGAWVAYPSSTEMSIEDGPVDTDGFICAYTYNSALTGYTDDKPNPTTDVAHAVYYTNKIDTVGITMPVKKGHYWKVVGYRILTSVHWLPIDS